MTDQTIQKYAFILGRERELCLAELRAVLNRFCFDFDILSVTDNIVFINIDKDREDVAKLSKVLGGTIKTFEIIGNPTDIRSAMTNYIEKKLSQTGKVTFGLSAYAPEHLNMTLRMINQLGFQAKKELRNLGISCRYLELRDSTEVSTILSLKEKLVGKGVEFGIFPNALGILIGLSNPEEWNIRDYEKPAGDKYSGMLPPKLARMMVNLALNAQKGSQSKPLVIDPFCGSGNVAIEALMLGCSTFGSDLSQKAVSDSEANINWLLNKYQIKEAKYKITKADATKDDFCTLISDFQPNNLVVVAEPFLGEPKKFRQTMNAARGEYGKVKDLYLEFFANIAKLQNCSITGHSSDVVFCVVFPLVETLEGKRFSLYRECVDEINKIGYTELQSPLIYGRDYQVVKREISLLTLQEE